MNKHFLIAVVAMIVCLTVLAVPNIMAQSNGDLKYVVDPTSVAYGRTYSDWSAAWWQWTFSIPVASHPLFDNGDCSVGQSVPVWFLGGKFCISGQNCPGTATRSCSVPSGKALYFPILNVEDSAPEEPNWGCGNNLPPLTTGTIGEMRQCVESFITGISNLKADVDGKKIRNLGQNFLVTSVQFDVTWPDDNVLTAIRGRTVPGWDVLPCRGRGGLCPARAAVAGQSYVALSGDVVLGCRAEHYVQPHGEMKHVEHRSR